MIPEYEKRAFERFAKPLRVRCTWNGQERFSEGAGLDISGGGIRVRFQGDIPDANTARLEISERGGSLRIKAGAKRVLRDEFENGSRIAAGEVAFEFTDSSLTELAQLFDSCGPAESDKVPVFS